MMEISVVTSVVSYEECTCTVSSLTVRNQIQSKKQNTVVSVSDVDDTDLRPKYSCVIRLVTSTRSQTMSCAFTFSFHNLTWMVCALSESMKVCLC